MEKLKIGDRILMLDTLTKEELYMSVGTIKEIYNDNKEIYNDNCIYYTVDFDKEVGMGLHDEELGIEDKHGRYISNFDKHIKIEEGKYANEEFRVGDEVIIYDKEFMDKAVKVEIKTSYNNKLLTRDKEGNVYVVYKEDVLFLLKRNETPVCKAVQYPSEEVVSVQSKERIIHHYNYTPNTFTFYETNGEEYPLYFGLEIELSGEKNSENEADTKALLEKLPENEFYAVHDGSINGVEIVSHPMSYKHIQTIDWNGFFQLANKLGYDNGDHQAGLHIHISKDWFEKYESEEITKIVYLVYKYKDRITEEIADRKPNCYCEYNYDVAISARYDNMFEIYRQFSLECEDEDSKYSAINNKHRDTYEFRMFDGATNVSDLFKRVEFVYKLALIVRENDIYSIQNITWEDIINRPIY